MRCRVCILPREDFSQIAAPYFWYGERGIARGLGRRGKGKDWGLAMMLERVDMAESVRFSRSEAVKISS